jgi:hypothetical protein
LKKVRIFIIIQTEKNRTFLVKYLLAALHKAIDLIYWGTPSDSAVTDAHDRACRRMFSEAFLRLPSADIACFRSFTAAAVKETPKVHCP